MYIGILLDARNVVDSRCEHNHARRVKLSTSCQPRATQPRQQTRSSAQAVLVSHFNPTNRASCIRPLNLSLLRCSRTASTFPSAPGSKLVASTANSRAPKAPLQTAPTRCCKQYTTGESNTGVAKLQNYKTAVHIAKVHPVCRYCNRSAINTTRDTDARHHPPTKMP